MNKHQGRVIVDSLPIGYADVVTLLKIDNRDDCFADGMELRADGIYVKTPPAEANAPEAAALSKHPTGNLAEAAISFPTDLGTFASFLEESGLFGMLEPFRVADWAISKHLELLAAKGSLASGGDWRWPWGAHETELLKQLAAAGEHFWSNYDPSEASSAPKSEDVTAWLKTRGVPDRVAEIMAQILRADTLPKGRRRI